MQKNASPTAEQRRIIYRAGLNPDEWVVVKSLYRYLMVKRRGTEEFRQIKK